MRVTIDLEHDIIIIPDNFFKKIKEDNERLKRYGATPVSGLERIKHSFATAISDIDNRLLTQTNAKERTKKVIVAAEPVAQVRVSDETVDKE